MRTWTDNEVLKRGQPQWKEDKQLVRFIYLQCERAEKVRANQINKRKCREKRRGPAC